MVALAFVFGKDTTIYGLKYIVKYVYISTKVLAAELSCQPFWR